MASEIPKKAELVEVTYRALVELGGTGTVKEIDDKVLEILDLPPEVAGRLQKGYTEKTQLEYKVAWCRTDLKKAGRITNIKSGVWTVTNVP